MSHRSSPIGDEHLSVLEDLTATRPHTGRTLFAHLVGTARLLEAWERPPEVCLAGLYHSIYGTQSYGIASVPASERSRIRSLIGERAERLAHLFCTSDRSGFFRELGEAEPRLRDRITDAPVPVSREDLVALVEIELANHLEFMPRTRLTPRELEELGSQAETARDHISAEILGAVDSAIRTFSLVQSGSV